MLRTDRGVETLGKVADLVPIDSPLKLFAEGHLGHASFLLVGMAQIRHPAGGLWQEWYLKLDGGQWGWLAEAQGNYYLTFEEPWLAAPRALAIGQRVDVPVRGTMKTMTVGEATTASYVGARGELPFRLVPSETFRYADLSDGQGTFATIDFGDDELPPKLYVGSQVNVADLRLTGGEVGPSEDTTISSQRLACPACNGPIELRAPGESLRAVCGYCNSLLDTSSGALAVLGKLATKAQPRIALGRTGTFVDGELTVIGYLQRSALVDGDWWPFDEYLLYRPGVGFRWLVESDGHWSYVQPIATGAVTVSPKGARYDGVSFTRYQTAQLRVDQVFGEVYWQVREGETVDSEDCIAPPAMVSRESSSTEETWSLSTYLTVAEVERAFGDPELALATPIGIAPNQPDAWSNAAAVMSVAFMVLLAVGLVFAMAARNEQKYYKDVSLGGGPGSVAPARPSFPASVTPGATTVLTEPTAVPECVEYKAVYDRLMTCRKLSASQRDAFKQLYDATFIPSDREVLASSCKTAIDMLHESFDADCALPTHAQYVASAGSAAGGSGSGSGSGSGGASSEVTTAPPDAVFFSDPIPLDGGRNVEISFKAPTLANDWVYLAADLVDDKSGGVASAEASMEYYSGIDGGESWSEGNRTSRTVFGPQPAGTYVLRLEAQHGSKGLLPVTVTVRQGVFRGKWLALGAARARDPALDHRPDLAPPREEALGEQQRRQGPGRRRLSILILAVAGVFVAIVFILKAMAESSSDD